MSESHGLIKPCHAWLFVRMIAIARLLLVVFAVLDSGTALASEYPCPSDPGFCYLDVSNDGCFDGGTDLGPINAQLESGPFPAILPPGDDLPLDPGSIVCPPSVKRLELPFGTPTDWRTAVGSDILIFGAKIFYKSTFIQGQSDDQITLRSGRDILLGEQISVQSSNASAVRPIGIHAERNIVVEAGVQARRCRGLGCHELEIFASTGDVSFGEKSKNSGSRIEIAAGGAVAVGDKASFKSTLDIQVEATGSITMTRPRLRTRSLRMLADGVSFDGVGLVKTDDAYIDARPGAFAAESLKLDVFRAPVIFGGLIQIGDAVGKPAKIRSRASALQLGSTADISIVNSQIFVETDVLIEQGGSSLAILSSRLRGKGFYNAVEFSTARIETGPGAVCDLTGTTFTSMDLVEDCETLIVP